MMKKHSSSDNIGTSATLDKIDPQVHEDDITEVAGSNRKKNDEVEVEKLVKWQLPGHHNIVSAKKALIHLLASLIMTHSTDVTIVDSKQCEWTFHDTDDEARFTKELEKLAVNLHSIKNKKENKIVCWVSITKIRLITGISDWKNNDYFYNEVRNAKVYLFPHPFGYEEWDIINIGFVKDIHTVHYP